MRSDVPNSPKKSDWDAAPGANRLAPRTDSLPSG
jgi:hypothetical protein